MSSSDNSQSYSTFYSTSSSSYTDSSGNTQAQHIQSDPSGTRITTANKPYDGQATYETRNLPSGSGSSALNGGSSFGSSDHRIEDVSDKTQEELDAQYAERMEDEYAKREGGA